jgi:hypothetical protein
MQETRQDDASRQAAVTLWAAGEISRSPCARQCHGAPRRPILWQIKALPLGLWPTPGHPAVQPPGGKRVLGSRRITVF